MPVSSHGEDVHATLWAGTCYEICTLDELGNTTRNWMLLNRIWCVSWMLLGAILMPGVLERTLCSNCSLFAIYRSRSSKPLNIHSYHIYSISDSG